MDNATKLYQGEKGVHYHRSVNEVSADIYPWISRLRRDKIQNFINEDDSVFEYGVGTAWNLAELRNKEKYGYDVSKHLRADIESLNIIFVDDVSKVKDSSVDVVICHHVIEHTEAPSKVLEDIHRILKPKGKLLLYVPFEKSRKYNKFNSKEPNQHLFSWNVQTLAKLVEVKGFNIYIAKRQIFGYDRFAAVLSKKYTLTKQHIDLLEDFYILLEQIMRFLFLLGHNNLTTNKQQNILI